MSRSPALADDEDASFSIDALVAQLQHDSEDLVYNLEKFTAERQTAVENQRRAFLEYETEIARIEAHYQNLERGIQQQQQEPQR